jgi:hypothetical protein
MSKTTSTTTDTRREALGKILFGAGHVGLRALATGLPAWMFTRAPEAWAQTDYKCVDKNKAQYLIVATSSAGDPMNANVPGTYDDPGIIHAADPKMAPTEITLAGRKAKGAQLWSTLPQWALDRSVFFHHATFTNNHPNLPKVMRLMGATYQSEMLPSILAKHLAPCFGTVQTEPVSVGAGDILTFEGRGLPNLQPTGLRDVLSKPKGAIGNLQALRDKHLDRMYALLKERGTKAQQRYIDDLVISRRQSRSLGEDLLGMLATITSDRGEGPVTAAITLLKMNVSPVIAIKIDFGGDNHFDDGLVKEVEQHETGIGYISKLMEGLKAAQMEDRVTFAAYNVFGRTLKKLGTKGRDHWASHHCAVMIGKPLKGGVIGGLEPKSGDFYATAINSTTGVKGGDIKFDDTLGAMGKTLGAAVGVDRAALDKEIRTGKVVQAALA